MRRAIQRYIEDPLADEVLRQGAMTPGSTVMIDRDEEGDKDDRPLSLTIIKPKKLPRSKPEPEKVGVGAKKGSDDAESGVDERADGNDAGDSDA